jgi:hypothetical protein
MDTEQLKARYGKSSAGNFEVIDTIGVPHPYTIGPKHVAHAADHHGGILGQHAIETGERNGIRCQHRGCTLSYAEHKQALLVECNAPLQVEENGEKVTAPELRAYLMKCKPLCEEDKYEGFAFLDRTKRRP